MRVWLTVLVSVLSACSGADRGSEGRTPGDGRSLTGIGLLGGEANEGFARATGPRRFVFPADHGSHPRFRTEWWYFTGNVDTADRARFGFELTFFRVALAPGAPQGTSGWRSNQLWMAHLAITDAADGRFSTAQRLARGALGLAGGVGDPFHVWVDDWSATGRADSASAALRLQARNGEMGLDLELRSQTSVVLQGVQGRDAKGPEPGNASYYYSMPRLAVSGEITVGGRDNTVQGSAWMDREWSTSALSDGVQGWDWLALQLGDGSDLMFYRLRRADGTASPFSAGAMIAANGKRESLAAGDVDLVPQQWWRSPTTGIEYPVAWSLRIPSRRISLAVTAVIPNQEIDLTVRYWEGAVDVRGTRGEAPLVGRGYLELAGYTTKRKPPAVSGRGSSR